MDCGPSHVKFASVGSIDGSATPPAKSLKPSAHASPSSGNGIWTLLDSNHLFLAGWVYDLPAIAKACRVKVADRCWVVILSTKDNALSLCPSAAAHGGAKSAMHTPPEGFNRSEIHRRFAKRASVGQAKQANWVPYGGGSN